MPASHHWIPTPLEVALGEHALGGQPVQVPVTTATPRPYRAATAVAPNGPCVRAYLSTRSRSGSATGSVKASGTPSGSATPSASAAGSASSIDLHRACPAMRRSGAPAAGPRGWRARRGRLRRVAGAQRDSSASAARAREAGRRRPQRPGSRGRREPLQLRARSRRAPSDRAARAARPAEQLGEQRRVQRAAPAPGVRPAARRPRT